MPYETVPKLFEMDGVELDITEDVNGHRPGGIV